MHAFATFTSTPLALFNVGGTEIVVILLLVLLLFGGEKMPELARGIGKALREFKKVSAGVEEELRRAMDEPPPKPKAYPPVQGATPYSVPPPPSALAPSSTNGDGLPPLPSDLGTQAALPPVAGAPATPPTEPTGTTPNPPPTGPTPPPVA